MQDITILTAQINVRSTKPSGLLLSLTEAERHEERIR